MTNIEKYIVEPERIDKLVHHDIKKMEEEAGSLWRFMESTLISEADITVLVRRVEQELDQSSEVGPDLHVHDVNQYYCLLDEFSLEATLGDEKKVVTGPATIMVKAGTAHKIRFIGGTGVLVNVLCKGKYE